MSSARDAIAGSARRITVLTLRQTFMVTPPVLDCMDQRYVAELHMVSQRYVAKIHMSSPSPKAPAAGAGPRPGTRGETASQTMKELMDKGTDRPFREPLYPLPPPRHG